MDKADFERLKTNFENLTGKKADENLETYFAYLNLLSSMNTNDYLKAIHNALPKTDKFGKILL